MGIDGSYTYVMYVYDYGRATGGYGPVWKGVDGYGWVWTGMEGYGWVWTGVVRYARV